MINIDFSVKAAPASKSIIDEISKTRKEIKKEKICKRCGLEAKKLYNTKTTSQFKRIMVKMDWMTISLSMVIASALCLLTSLIVLEILKKR